MRGMMWRRGIHVRLCKNVPGSIKLICTMTGPSVEDAFRITHAQFLEWNPAVSKDCLSGFWAGYSYCVGVNPNATSTIMSTTSSSSAATQTYSILPNGTSASLAPMPSATDWPPSPRQSGILLNCKVSLWGFYCQCSSELQVFDTIRREWEILAM
jgi:hypothetical protein